MCATARAYAQRGVCVCVSDVRTLWATSEPTVYWRTSFQTVRTHTRSNASVGTVFSSSFFAEWSSSMKCKIKIKKLENQFVQARRFVLLHAYTSPSSMTVQRPVDKLRSGRESGEWRYQDAQHCRHNEGKRIVILSLVQWTRTLCLDGLFAVPLFRIGQIWCRVTCRRPLTISISDSWTFLPREGRGSNYQTSLTRSRILQPLPPAPGVLCSRNPNFVGRGGGAWPVQNFFVWTSRELLLGPFLDHYECKTWFEYQVKSQSSTAGTQSFLKKGNFSKCLYFKRDGPRSRQTVWGSVK